MKLPIRTIVFPVDFSHRSRLAAPYVKTMAARYGAKLLALHVVDPVEHLVHLVDVPNVSSEELRARWLIQAKARLEAFVAKELAGPAAAPIDVEQIVEPGEAGRKIVDLAHSRGVDWIMMPTHGFSAFRRFVLGSVTAHVLHEARCPVWTAAIHEEGQDAAQCHPREIIAAVAFDDRAEHVILYASELAQDHHATLTIAHATPPVTTPALDWAGGDFNDKIAHQACHSLGMMLGKLGLKAHLAVRCGDTARTLRHLASERSADLLVIARGSVTAGTGRLRAHSYGIVNEAPCPVLSV